MLSLIAIIMIAAMALSACATPAPETEVPVEGAVDWTKVTPAKNITFWHQHTGEDREAAMEKIVNDFNATNEYGITLTAEYAGGYGDIYTKMLALLNTPDVPDIVVGYQNQIATYQLADSMFDMNTVINDPV